MDALGTTVAAILESASRSKSCPQKALNPLCTVFHQRGEGRLPLCFLLLSHNRFIGSNPIRSVFQTTISSAVREYTLRARGAAKTNRVKSPTQRGGNASGGGAKPFSKAVTRAKTDNRSQGACQDTTCVSKELSTTQISQDTGHWEKGPRDGQRKLSTSTLQRKNPLERSSALTTHALPESRYTINTTQRTRTSLVFIWTRTTSPAAMILPATPSPPGQHENREDDQSDIHCICIRSLVNARMTTHSGALSFKTVTAKF